MSAEIVNVSGRLLTLKFSGIVTYPEFTAGQQGVAELIRQHGKLRILAMLENFRGWAPEGDWGDTTWVDQYDPLIERIAIVGDKKWEEQVLWFTLQGLRKALIEYFQPADLSKALAWLNEADDDPRSKRRPPA
jgi:hypothetical protein